MAYPLLGQNYNDSANIDAFNRLRVSNNKTLFETSFQYSLKRGFWWMTASGTASIDHDQARASANMTVNALGDVAVLQSKAYIPYEPGKSQLIKMTYVPGDKMAIKEVGYFDDNDGIFLRVKQFYKPFFVLRSTVPSGTILTGGTSPVFSEREIYREQWNVDKLDGTGPSGRILDITKQQILVIDLQFLGTGRVRCGFNIDGKIYYCHEFLNANVYDVAPYMRTATLPLRYRIQGTDSTKDVLQVICCEVESEGGSEPQTYDFSAFTPNEVTVASGTRTHLISVTPKLLYRNLIPNRMTIILINVDILCGSNPILVELLYNSTVTGGTILSANDLSCANYITGGTVSLKPSTKYDCGTIMTQAFYIPSGTGAQKNAVSTTFNSQFPVSLNIAGDAGTIYSVVATGLGGSAGVRCALSWKEIR